MLKKLIFLLSHKERKQTALLLLIIIINTLLDAIGVASILPFIAILSNPELIETNNFLNTIFQISNIFGVETNQEFFFVLGIFNLKKMINSFIAIVNQIDIFVF